MSALTVLLFWFTNLAANGSGLNSLSPVRDCASFLSDHSQFREDLVTLIHLGMERGWIIDESWQQMEQPLGGQLWKRTLMATAEHLEISTEELLGLVREALSSKATAETTRAAVADDVRAADRFWFVPIVPRPVKVHPSDRGMAGNYRLQQAFEIMDRPVTLGLWESVMGERPTDEEDCPLDQSSPKEPVREISWASALVFANRFSALHGFPEPYLINMSGSYGDAAKGKLILGRGTVARVRLRPPSRDIYNAEGFRLPTGAELTSILMDDELRPSFQELKDNEDNEFELIAGRSALRTSSEILEVAQFLPIQLRGQEIHNFLGLVHFWTQDSAQAQKSKVSGRANPWSPDKRKAYFYFGIDRESAALEDTIPMYPSSAGGRGDRSVSLILVRSRPDIWREK